MTFTTGFVVNILVHLYMSQAKQEYGYKLDGSIADYREGKKKV